MRASTSETAAKSKPNAGGGSPGAAPVGEARLRAGLQRRHDRGRGVAAWAPGRGARRTERRAGAARVLRAPRIVERGADQAPVEYGVLQTFPLPAQLLFTARPFHRPCPTRRG